MRVFLRYETEKGGLEMMYVSQLLKAGHQMRVPNQLTKTEISTHANQSSGKWLFSQKTCHEVSQM